MNNIIFGIDFGTSNTVISYFENNKTHILSDGIYKSIPTKIGIDFSNNKIYCGNYIPLNIDKIIYNFKTLEQLELIHFNNKVLTLNDIFIIFFSHIKNIITKKFNLINNNTQTINNNTQTINNNIQTINNNTQTINNNTQTINNNIQTLDTIITVPSNFNDNQREMIKNSFIFNGFNVLRIINEPSAAALAYGLSSNNLEEKILVIDTGGGTMDITVLVKDNTFFEVESSIGINDLGGNNFTDVIYNYILKQIDDKNINTNNLWYQCQTAKEKLSYLDLYEIKINKLIYTITKKQFEKLCNGLINKIEELLLTIDNTIDYIILVGNSSKIPILQKIIYDIFKIKPWIHPNLDSVVSEGASLYGAIIKNIYNVNTNVILIDVLPLSLGVELVDGTFSIIIPKNTPLPIKLTQKYTIDTPTEKSVPIKVYQGERKIANKNTLIGEFIFDKITPGGVPIIEICIKVDLNGIINIIITDKKSGIDKNILIKEIPKLNSDDIEYLINCATINDEIDNNELIFNSRLYQITTKIEIIINNININDKIEDKTSLFNEILLIENKLEYIKLSNKESNTFNKENNTLLLNIINNINDKYSLFINNNNIEENIIDTNDLIEIMLLKDTLNSKINILLNKNPEWDEYLTPIIDKLTETNISLEYLKDKLEIIKELEDDTIECNYKEQFKNLCLFIKKELEVGNINLDNEKLNKLNILINDSLKLINDNIDIDWYNKLLYLNTYCDNLC